MLRRDLLQFGTAAVARALTGQQKQGEDVAVAAPSQDKTPRVGIVLSSFTGSKDHDGTQVPGLADPKPVSADLNAAQLDAMLRKAIELGGTRRGGLASIVHPGDWVVIKPDVSACPGPERPYIPGSVTDLRLVRSLIAWLVEHRCGRRITIAEGSDEWLPAARSKAPVDGWSTDWGGAFGGLSYQGIVADFSKRHPSIKFDLVDLNSDEILELPVPGKPSARQNRDGVYYIPQTIQQCDRLISITPLKSHPRTVVSLAIGNYFGIAPGAKYGFPRKQLFELGAPHEVLMDLFSFHTADYAILGGGWGRDGDRAATRSVHYNLIIAGASAPAVDAVGAAVMGFTASEIPHLTLAERKGFGIIDLDSIWTRGNKIEEARGALRKA